MDDSLEEDLEVSAEQAEEISDNADCLTDLAFRLSNKVDDFAVTTLTIALAQACAFSGIAAESIVNSLLNTEKEILENINNNSDDLKNKEMN